MRLDLERAQSQLKETQREYNTLLSAVNQGHAAQDNVSQLKSQLFVQMILNENTLSAPMLKLLRFMQENDWWSETPSY